VHRKRKAEKKKWGRGGRKKRKFTGKKFLVAKDKNDMQFMIPCHEVITPVP